MMAAHRIRSAAWMARLVTAAGIVVAATAMSAQQPLRRAAAISALATYPAFFHGQPVLVRGTLTTRSDGMTLTATGVDSALRLVFRGASPPDGSVELRGTFWDVGRLENGDPRVASEGIEAVLPALPEGEWPAPGELLALTVTDAMTVTLPEIPATLRLIALDPASYAGQRVTVIGQFQGRNLFGDLPQAPSLSQWDFVLRSADAAIWVTGQRPRGRDFDLNVTARVDTGRWLEVAGIVRHARGLVWLEAPQISLGKPPAEPRAEQTATRPAIGPPPEVIFSDPSEGELDVALKKVVRLQFSRDMNPQSFTGRVRLRYGAAPAPDSGQVENTTKVLASEYVAANRGIELRLEVDPGARFRPVTIELDEGITATDGSALKPWTLTFSFGGS